MPENDGWFYCVKCGGKFKYEDLSLTNVCVKCSGAALNGHIDSTSTANGAINTELPAHECSDQVIMRNGNGVIEIFCANERPSLKGQLCLLSTAVKGCGYRTIPEKTKVYCGECRHYPHGFIGSSICPDEKILCASIKNTSRKVLAKSPLRRETEMYEYGTCCAINKNNDCPNYENFSPYGYATESKKKWWQVWK